MLKQWSMTNSSTMLTPREAARLIGISYPTIKQWILAGKLKTSRTPGGHHRVSEASLKPFLAGDKQKPAAESRERYRRVSGRNQLAGKVISVRIEGCRSCARHRRRPYDCHHYIQRCTRAPIEEGRHRGRSRQIDRCDDRAPRRSLLAVSSCCHYKSQDFRKLTFAQIRTD